MKKRLMALTGVVLVLALLAGCSTGISQAKYDSMVIERDSALAKLTKAQADLQAAQDEIRRLEASGGGTSGTGVGPTDITKVNWNPQLYINKVHGFKLYYPQGWDITQENTRETVPVEIHMANPGSWVSIIADSDTNNWTGMDYYDVIAGVFIGAEIVTTGTTVLADNTTPAAYGEFSAMIDEQWWMHCYSVGYIDGNRWIVFIVWTIEESLEWDGVFMRQVAHTFSKATASEIAGATSAPVVTATTTAPTTTSTTPYLAPLTTFTDNVNGFSFGYNSMWVQFDYEIEGNLAHFASEEWVCPGVRVDRHPEAAAATLFDLIPTILGEQAEPEKFTDEELTNDNGITATAHVIQYTAPDGFRLDGKIFGFIKDGQWWTLVIYQANTLGTLEGQDPDRIFNTWEVN